MTIRQSVCAVLLPICSAASWAEKPAAFPSPNQIQTSLSERACRRPSPSIRTSYAKRGLGVVRCPAPKGFTLLLVSSDAHSWIDLIHGKSTWSSEQAVVYRPNPGMFPNIAGNVTWLKDTENRVKGIVFSVVSEDEEGKKSLTHFGVRGALAHPQVCAFHQRLEALQFSGVLPADEGPCPEEVKLGP
ncbi:hypothetical protein [Zoogloea sp.]|uniref:hypothetical protein n=1 Tax=Zoogloea sp. TaxID=49181 RepID=UPI0035B15636